VIGFVGCYGGCGHVRPSFGVTRGAGLLSSVPQVSACGNADLSSYPLHAWLVYVILGASQFPRETIRKVKDILPSFFASAITTMMRRPIRY
jgi:hypothetical protein